MTQKKDFALKLEGCSKADREEVYALGESVGFVENSRPIRKKLCSYLMFISGRMFYYGKGEPIQGDRIIYQMPADWSEIQEALGVSVEPKDGEVYVMNTYFDWLFRAKVEGFSDYSRITLDDNSATIGCSGSWGSYNYPIRKATPKEEKQLIEAEHKNGYHWDGESLVKIPEYVKCIDDSDFNQLGVIYPVNNNLVNMRGKNNAPVSVILFLDIFEPSTLEAFEAQEAKKNNIGVLTYKVKFDMTEATRALQSFRKEADVLGLTTKVKAVTKENKKLTERITDLEGENLGYKKLLEKRDKQNKRQVVIIKELKEASLRWLENRIDNLINS